MQTAQLRSRTYSQTGEQTYTGNHEHARNRALINCRKIVAGLRHGAIVFRADELVPKMLAVGETRGTSDFEGAVKDLLVTLARKVPSEEYRRDFEHFI